MDSASFLFVIFGLCTATASNLSLSPIWRSLVLGIASAIFLATLSPSPEAFLPLLGFLALGYAALTFLDRISARPLPLLISIVVLSYVWLKKYTFLPGRTFLDFPYLTIGLSYIFFRVLQLLIETADLKESRHVGIASYLLYTLNFTTLVSGPIQRFEEFARDQFAGSPMALDASMIGAQLERIVRGFFKVNVLGTMFNLLQTECLSHLSATSNQAVHYAWALPLVVVYPLFLYANFSGYIDIVIAIGRLIRLQLPENFDRPFSAASVMEFWNRWHMTLSAWLKTFVYNPLLLALMRRNSSLSVQPFLAVFCFFVTFFLIGIWHGRTSEFIFFGFLTGAGISGNKLWQLEFVRLLGRPRYKRMSTNAIYVAAARGLNFLWFSFTLFWFWGRWDELHAIYCALPTWQWLAIWTIAWIAVSLVLAAWESIHSSIAGNSKGIAWFQNRYARVALTTSLGFFALVFTVVLNQPAPGIVYKAF